MEKPGYISFLPALTVMRILLAAYLLFMAGCQLDNQRHAVSHHTIYILPLNNFPKNISSQIFQKLRTHLPNVQLLPNETIPAFAFNEERKRFRADEILRWLEKKSGSNEKYIALTQHDISTTKGKIKDWGVMGLAQQPGSAAVASNYRLKNKNNFYKVVMHELAHSSGLPHCPQKTCFLRDAKGGDHSEEEISFCSNCTQRLTALGWML